MNRTQKQIASIESDLEDVHEQLFSLFTRLEKVERFTKRWENR
jgi:hypothetical protein